MGWKRYISGEHDEGIGLSWFGLKKYIGGEHDENIGLSWFGLKKYIGDEHDEDIGFWFYFDCHLIVCLKNYLNIWILKNK